jgi:hypothetical protein
LEAAAVPAPDAAEAAVKAPDVAKEADKALDAAVPEPDSAAKRRRISIGSRFFFGPEDVRIYFLVLPNSVCRGY